MAALPSSRGLRHIPVQRSSPGSNAPISPPAPATQLITLALAFAIVHNCTKRVGAVQPPPSLEFEIHTLRWDSPHASPPSMWDCEGIPFPAWIRN